MSDLPKAKSRLTTFSCQFVVEDDCIIPLNTKQRRKGSGDFQLLIDWPRSEADGPTGFVKISHSDWQTLPRFVLLVGIRNRDSGLIWRLLCPITRELAQVLYFDPDSQLFVARSAIGRKQRSADFAYLMRQWSLQLDLEDKQLKLAKKSGKLADLMRQPLEDALRQVKLDVKLAASGIPKPILNFDGGFDVLAMAKKSAQKSQPYYRDKSGVIKLTPTAKRTLGIR